MAERKPEQQGWVTRLTQSSVESLQRHAAAARELQRLDNRLRDLSNTNLYLRDLEMLRRDLIERSKEILQSDLDRIKHSVVDDSVKQKQIAAARARHQERLARVEAWYQRTHRQLMERYHAIFARHPETTALAFRYLVKPLVERLPQATKGVSNR